MRIELDCVAPHSHAVPLQPLILRRQSTVQLLSPGGTSSGGGGGGSGGGGSSAGTGAPTILTCRQRILTNTEQSLQHFRRCADTSEFIAATMFILAEHHLQQYLSLIHI